MLGNSEEKESMNISPSQLLLQPNVPPSSSSVILPDDLVVEVLSYLSVKSLMRLRCVCKFWNALITDPTFIKSHLKKSEENAYIIGISITLDFPIYLELESERLVENPLICNVDDSYRQLKKGKDLVAVGYCHGLLCFNSNVENQLYFWNPATKKVSKKLGCNTNITNRRRSLDFTYGFGYDVLTDTYKAVAFGQMGRDAKVLSLGDDIWRNIQSFPEVCLHSLVCFNNCAYLSGTLNRLVFKKDNANHLGKVEHCIMIISLDLGTETFTQMRCPQGFDDKMSEGVLTLCVMMDCLCFTHDYKGIHFVVWKMMEFGVYESWTPLFKIPYDNLPLHDFDPIDRPLKVLRLYRDTLILIDPCSRSSILYNCKNKKGELATITKATTIREEKWWIYINNYVESLVSTNGK